MEWKLNPCFDIELSALTDIRRNSFVGRKRFKCRYKCEILRGKISPFFFTIGRSIVEH